jgi:hypothetical protein
VASSSARNRPFVSPPNTRPPAVDSSDMTAARWSYVQSVAPVSTEIAWTLPTSVRLPAMRCSLLSPYSESRLGRLSVGAAVMHVFWSGKNIVFDDGLYAPDGQFLPPSGVGQIVRSWPISTNVVSGLTVASPVSPSIPSSTFCSTVGLAQRNSPVRASSVYTTPVLPGIPVTTLRLSPERSRGLSHVTARRSGAIAVSTSRRSNG